MIHGRSGYTNRDCRCPVCTEAQRLYHERRRRRLGVPTIAEYRAGLSRTHGIRATYVDGCRCVPCRDAERRYMNDYRARRRSTRR